MTEKDLRERIKEVATHGVHTAVCDPCKEF